MDQRIISCHNLECVMIESLRTIILKLIIKNKVQNSIPNPNVYYLLLKELKGEMGTFRLDAMAALSKYIYTFYSSNFILK